jgi:hypothetical protein
MPKFKVYVHETIGFIYSLEAPDEKAAGNLALQLHQETQRNEDFNDIEINKVVSLPEDAEVENQD